MRTAPIWGELVFPPGGIIDAACKVGSDAMFSKFRYPLLCLDRMNVRMESIVLSVGLIRGAAGRIVPSMIFWSPVDLIISYSRLGSTFASKY
jgi:hypothetical protein